MNAPEASDLRTRICLGGILFGVIVGAAGLFWSQWAKPSLVWTPEQAAEYQAAGEALHAARRVDPASSGDVHASAGAEGDEPDRRLAAAQERFDKIEAKLAAAQTLRQRTGAWLRWLGLAAIVLFGVGYLSSRRE
jgi:hypothetical protein